MASAGSCRSVGAVDQFNLGLLMLRVVFGLFLAYHGYNKFFGPGGLDGHGRLVRQHRHALAEVAGPPRRDHRDRRRRADGAGLLTPLAAAGMIGVMIVAIVVEHWKVGFFIFKPEPGLGVLRVDRRHRVRASPRSGPGGGRSTTRSTSSGTGWTGAVIAAVAGVGGAVLQLAVCYRPKADMIGHQSTDAADPTAQPRPGTAGCGAVLVLICALIAAMWVYAFIFAPKQGVYFVTDKAWRTSRRADLRRRPSASDWRSSTPTQGYISNPTHEQMTAARRHRRPGHRHPRTACSTDVAALPLAADDDRERVAIFVKYYRHDHRRPQGVHRAAARVRARALSTRRWSTAAR